MSGGSEFEFEYVIIHPYYDIQVDKDFDVALIKLLTPITFGKTMQAITLPAQGEMLEPGTPCNVTGWGYEVEGGANWNPSVLRLVILPIVSHDLCNDTVGGDLTSSMICAGYDEGGTLKI